MTSAERLRFDTSVPNLILKGSDAQPLIELQGRLADGAAGRLLTLSGRLDVGVDGREGPACVEGTLRFLVPTAPSWSASMPASSVRVSVAVHALGINPVSSSDARVSVLAARGLVVPDGRGAQTLGVELRLETLYLLVSQTVMLGYVVHATVSEAPSP